MIAFAKSGAQVGERSTCRNSDSAADVWRYADAFETQVLVGKAMGVLSHCPDPEHAGARLDDVLDALAAVPSSLCATVEALCPMPQGDPHAVFRWLIDPSDKQWGGLSAAVFRMYNACRFAAALPTPTPEELRAYVVLEDRAAALDAIHEERERQREQDEADRTSALIALYEPEYRRPQVVR